MRSEMFLKLKVPDILKSRFQSIKDSISHFALPTSKIPDQHGITALAILTILGLFLAVSLALVGTGTIKLPGGANLAVSPIPISDPVEDDETCQDESNAECDFELDNDPEDLTPAQIEQLLQEP